MKFCIRCGKELLPNAKFCYKCGATVTTVQKSTLHEPVAKSKQDIPLPAQPYKSPIAETYYETIFKPAAEEKLSKNSHHVKRREGPTKPFE